MTTTMNRGRVRIEEGAGERPVVTEGPRHPKCGIIRVVGFQKWNGQFLEKPVDLHNWACPHCAAIRIAELVEAQMEILWLLSRDIDAKLIHAEVRGPGTLDEIAAKGIDLLRRRYGVSGVRVRMFDGHIAVICTASDELEDAFETAGGTVTTRGDLVFTKVRDIVDKADLFSTHTNLLKHGSLSSNHQIQLSRLFGRLSPTAADRWTPWGPRADVAAGLPPMDEHATDAQTDVPDEGNCPTENVAPSERADRWYPMGTLTREIRKECEAGGERDPDFVAVAVFYEELAARYRDLGYMTREEVTAIWQRTMSDSDS